MEQYIEKGISKRRYSKIIGFSYEVLDGRQSVVIRGDLPLVQPLSSC